MILPGNCKAFSGAAGAEIGYICLVSPAAGIPHSHGFEDETGLGWHVLSQSVSVVSLALGSGLG